MDEKLLEAREAAGKISMPNLPEKKPFSASGKEKIAAFLMYIAAYIYWSKGLSGWGLLCFTAAFIALTEFLNWEKPRSRESWVWLGCVLVITAGIYFGRASAWGDVYPYLFLHVFAVWWVLSRSGRLLEGESGHLLPFDALNGFFVFPFRHFFLRIRTVWFTLTHFRRRESRAKAENIGWTIIAVLVSCGLLIMAAGLLITADTGFAKLMSGLADALQFKINADICLYFLLSLPVGAYLFGLIAGSGREEKDKLIKKGEAICGALRQLRKVPNLVLTVLTGLFCLLYLLFFIVQAQYLFGAFTRTLPEGFIVSQYARQGFFELCKVMAVNFVLLWLVSRMSAKPLRENTPAKLFCAVLLIECMLFAVVAFSKLTLYISCFGFTPLRLQSSWLVCVLFAGCVCAMYSLLRGRKSFRAWMIFGAVTLSLLHLY